MGRGVYRNGVECENKKGTEGKRLVIGSLYG